VVNLFFIVCNIRNLQKFPRIPKSPKVVISGSPNVGTMMFAHRLAIDIGVPAVSMKNIFKNLLNTEEYYRSEEFYRKVINLLKNPNVEEVQRELEANAIPEKLLTLTKYTELGFVLYEYPSTIKQCEKYYFIFKFEYFLKIYLFMFRRST